MAEVTEANLTQAPVESPAVVHQDAVVAIPVPSNDAHVVVHIPTVNPHPTGTVEAPGITVA